MRLGCVEGTRAIRSNESVPCLVRYRFNRRRSGTRGPARTREHDSRTAGGNGSLLYAEVEVRLLAVNRALAGLRARSEMGESVPIRWWGRGLESGRF